MAVVVVASGAQGAPRIDLQKMGLGSADAVPVAAPESAPVVPAAQGSAGADAAALADLSGQVAKILGKIKQLETRTCSATHYDNFGFDYDDDCTVDNSYYVKSSVDSQTKIALDMARDMIKNGQLKLAADAIKAIKKRSVGYFEGGTMPHGEVLYFSGQVDHLTDLAVKAIESADPSVAGK